MIIRKIENNENETEFITKSEFNESIKELSDGVKTLTHSIQQLTECITILFEKLNNK